MLKLDDPLLWGNEAAEDEDPAVLSSYFTAHSAFDAFFDLACACASPLHATVWANRRCCASASSARAGMRARSSYR